jgi:hypothetical protein
MKEACFTKALTVAFSEEIYLRIKEITNHKKISMGEWVRLAAERAMDEEVQCKSRETKQDEKKEN